MSANNRYLSVSVAEAIGQSAMYIRFPERTMYGTSQCLPEERAVAVTVTFFLSEISIMLMFGSPFVNVLSPACTMSKTLRESMWETLNPYFFLTSGREENSLNPVSSQMTGVVEETT